MTPPNRIFLWALALSVPAVPLARAGEGQPDSGKVLVLDNARTLEGDIERVGDRYRIRRSVGATWVPAAKALFLCDSQEEAYRFLAGRTNLRDPDERLRLARWCHLHGLREQALTEARAAVELRPEHPESRRLLHYFEQSALHAAKADRPAPEKPAAVEKPSDDEADAVPAIDLSAEAMSLFATRVQPILINTCARCHASGEAGAFRLKRPYAFGAGSRKTMQRNLASVLAQLNTRRPELSPLLIKAVSAHSPRGAAPLSGRQMAAYRTLEDWVKLTVASNPHLRAESDTTADVSEAQEPKGNSPAPVRPLAAVTPVPAKPAPVRFDVPFIASPSPGGPATPRPTPITPGAAAPAEPADEFDPIHFNRKAHPNRPAPPRPTGKVG